VDFTPYFAFIESRPSVKKGEKHHILPENEFPNFKNAVGNLIRVSTGDHLMAHYYLALCAPDFVPFQMVFYFMANFRKYASQIKLEELPSFCEIFEKGRERQKVIAAEVGRQNVISGQFAKIQTVENSLKGGRVAGRIAVDSGQLAKASVLGGLASLKLGLSSLNLSQMKPEDLSKWGTKGNHVRFHVNRGITNSECSLCGGKDQ